MNILQNLEKFLKSNNNENVLGIRFFSGTQKFSNNLGQFESPTLEESLKMYLSKIENKNYLELDGRGLE